MEKKEYLGFKYWLASEGSYWVIYPVGFKTIIPAENEATLLVKLNNIIAKTY